MDKVNKVINDFDNTDKSIEALTKFGQDVAKEAILLNDIDQSEAWHNVRKKIYNIPLELSFEETIKTQEEANKAGINNFEILKIIATGAMDIIENNEQRNMLIEGITNYSKLVKPSTITPVPNPTSTAKKTTLK